MSRSQPVEIQWCDHSSVILEYLRQLYEEGRFVDVGLECEGRQVKAHKSVISACSPYLEGLLKGNPARSHLIKFNGYSYASLRSVIDFMYNGKVVMDQENLAAFLKLGRALQVRGILDIASQCEEAGLTTPEETKSNAQYSSTVNQQKISQAKSQSDGKKYPFMMDKTQPRKGIPYKPKSITQNVLGTTDQSSGLIKSNNGSLQVQQTSQSHQDQSEASQATIEEIQQALASGQALLQTDANGAEQTLQMVEGQCVVTGSGQAYVVVQEGDNLSFVPAEMVQGDLPVNGTQVMESLDGVNVEQHLSHIENSAEVTEPTESSTEQPAQKSDTGMDTMSVVESLVQLGKQPTDSDKPSGDDLPTEIGPDMPCLDAEIPVTSQM